MFIDFIKQIRIALVLLILFSILTGLIYPAVVAGIAQLFFPWKANGSLIQQNKHFVGSLLIGQSFTEPQYFWGRPSATSPFPYNSASSAASNMGPSNPAFLTAVKDRVDNIRKLNPENRSLVPVDLVTTSGSGLDPEISPLAALYQVPRIAKARNIPPAEIETLIQNATKERTLSILGEPRVNVLMLNLALDNLRMQDGQSTKP